DCRTIGVTAPVRASGQVTGSGSVMLEGPAGSIQLPQGTIIAARHIHVSPPDAQRLGLKDGDRVTVALGSDDRRAILPDVLVRSGSTHATEMHLDTDEAGAFGVKTGDLATLVGRPLSGGRRSSQRAAKPLITERDVDAVAARGEALSDNSP